MDQMELLRQQVDLAKKESEFLGKSMGMEFERISRAFSQMGNLIDLLYLEVSVLIEMLAKKEVINQEEFTKTLEETAVKVEESIKKAAEDEAAKKDGPKIETI